MSEILNDCKCIDRDDKHELRKAVIARIELYNKNIKEIEYGETIEQIENLDAGEEEIKLSSKSTKNINQYKDIIYRLENLHNRLENTPECKYVQKSVY